VDLDLALRLDQMLAVAKTGLYEAAGGGAVCAFTKSGTPVPGIKYHEGRWAALHEVSGQCADGTHDAATAALDISRRWSADLEKRILHGAGPDWIAYRHGGLDALTELLADAAPASGA
jgi:hypothetical protein